MSAVPIDAKSRGALLAARDDLADLNQDIAVALPALQGCGSPDVALQAHWLKVNLDQIRACVNLLCERTTDARQNQFPRRAR